MHYFIYFVFVSILLSNIHFGLCSDVNVEIPVDEYPEVVNDNEADPSLLSLSTTTPTIEPVVEDIVDDVTESTTIVTDSVAEDIVDDVTEPLTTTTTTTDATTTIINEEQLRHFLTKYSLNANLSSLADVTFNTYLNNSVFLIVENHEIVLVNKNDGTIKNHYKSASIVPINQPNFLVIFDDNTQELSILNTTHEQKSIISFKPKQIFTGSLTNNVWVAETSDEVTLYSSQTNGLNWEKIDNTSSCTILGWSDKTNSFVIVQHSRYIKLVDVITHKIQTILADVSSTTLFSRYMFAKQSNLDNSIIVSHINNLVDEGFRSLPRRLQSQGNFYCAIEDRNTQDLLLLFITDKKAGENNETLPSTCNLVAYSKANRFNLTNIDCGLIHNDSLSNAIECSTTQLPIYQVRGLSKSVFLANVATGPTTMISFNGGINWNKTRYECDKMMNCPDNASIVISSLISSYDAPGMVVGKATNGINEYVAVSSDGGRMWRLSSKGNDYLTAMSTPSALIVTVPKHNQPSSNHSFRYSTDYGRTWHEQTLANETSSRVISLLVDNNNLFYLLTLDDESLLSLLQLDLNLMIGKQCARHQLKEWSLQGTCVNGSKFYYKRRISGSHCLDNASEIRTEPCACSLSDFQCLPGYRRSTDGMCLPKSHYIFSQDCPCTDNQTIVTKRRGYVKFEDSQCRDGLETYLSDTYVTRRDSNHPNFFLYGVHPQTKRATIEIHSNDFSEEDGDDDDEDEDLTQDITWLVEPTHEITAVVSDADGQQVYMAVEHEQSTSIYRVKENLRQQSRSKQQLKFDSNDELYKSTNERIEYLTLDWLTQNLYVLVRNKNTLQQNIFILDTRTQKRRTIVKNQNIQPAILLIDPIKTDLYWISHNSPSTFNIGNLQGQTKNKFQLLSANANVSYMSYDSIAHEIIYVVDSIIYGLNTLDHSRLSPRIIYEHSSTIHNALFVHPVLYFTNENNHTDSSMIYLHAINILAKSYAKNIAKFKDFDSLKLFIDMAPNMPKSAIAINRCAENPCSDLCLPLEHGQFRCLCADNARFASCLCPTAERFTTGSCQTKNGQCAPGRVLCQNGVNCAESAGVCEQDHTQYTEAFKNSARCTLEKENDGFDCYYNELGRTNQTNTCIPSEWLCDGEYDCPLGNDEEHCHKMTTTKRPVTKVSSRCLTDRKFTHVMCGNQCMKISDVCRDASNELVCSTQFHLHCQRSPQENQYACKCRDTRSRCIAMVESCDSFEHCQQVCKDSIHYATTKTNPVFKPSSMIWLILLIGILLLLFIAILVMTLRYRRRRKTAKQTPVSSRTPAEVITTTTTHSPSSDTREKLLNNASKSANETS